MILTGKYALTTPNGSFPASGQAHGIAASLVVNITWINSDPMLSDLKINFNIWGDILTNFKY